MLETAGESLDPKDWPAFRALAHHMLDDMLDYTQHIQMRPVWQPLPEALKAQLQQPVSEKTLEQAHRHFMTTILPYAVGNTHPRFMGWVHGGGGWVYGWKEVQP